MKRVKAPVRSAAPALQVFGTAAVPDVRSLTDKILREKDPAVKVAAFNMLATALRPAPVTIQNCNFEARRK